MKIPDHENCITTPGFNNLTKENFDERLKQANLANRFWHQKKTDFDKK